jgi:DNA-binding winged helix-turn-helix (wHTH) protein/tetratricopeptide (TPR) repeat protein
MSSDLELKFHQNNLSGARHSDSNIYGFEDYRFDVGHLMLYRGGEEVQLTPKQAETLLALIEQRGEIVSKDALMARLWGDAAVEESNLIQNIYVLRKTLGVMHDGRPMIETLRRRGYRFNAELTDHKHRSPVVSAAIRLESIASVLHPDESEAPTENDNNIWARERSTRNIVVRIAAIALLVTATVGAYFVFLSKPAGPVGKKLAVLPLHATNPADKNQLFGIGIADSLINRLNSTEELTVRSLSSVRKYTEVDPDPIAAGLDQKVDYILASSYQLANGQIRVNSNLLNVATGKVEGTFTSEYDAGNAFAAHDAIVENIGNKILVWFGSEVTEFKSKRGTSSVEAYQNYLQAMILLDQQRPGGTDKAREYLDRAVEIDPNYARAWAGKAHAYSVMWIPGRPYEPENPGVIYESSMDAAKRALAIDPSLSEAYTSLCENKFAYELNYAEAEKDCKRAIDLDRNSSSARRMYSMLLASRGQSVEALSEIKIAMELEPASLRNQRIHANILYWGRRYNEAIEAYKRLFDLNPDAPATHLYLIRSLERSGREPEALEVLIKLLIHQKKDEATIDRFRAAYASSGWRGVLNERINTELQERSPQYSHVGEYYGLLGDKDKAFEYLEKNLPKRGWMKMFFRVDPRFDGLRDDPRFDELVKRGEARNRDN